MQDVPIDLAQYAREESAIAISSSKLQEMYIQVRNRVADATAPYSADHFQLRKLRDTVPSLIRPMQSTSRSPEIIYAEFAKAAAGAVNSTQDFATLMKTKTCQDILLQTRRSRLNDDEGISSWLSDEHEDWLDKPSLVGMKKELDNDAEHMDMAPNLTMEQAIDAFKEAHIGTEPSISLTENEILVSDLYSDFFSLLMLVVFALACRYSLSHPDKGYIPSAHCILSHLPKNIRLDKAIKTTHRHKSSSFSSTQAIRSFTYLGKEIHHSP